MRIFCSHNHPCFSDLADYRNQISIITGYMHYVVSSNTWTDIMLLGDFNFDFNSDNPGFNIFNSFINNVGMCSCDNFMHRDCIDRRTFINSRNIGSCIDHIVISNSLLPYVDKVTIVDSAVNYSDHRPVSMAMNRAIIDPPAGRSIITDANSACRPSNAKPYALRWDTSDLNSFYYYSSSLLSSIY